MQKTKFNIPLKYKFILFLVLLIALTLFSFLWVSLSSYKDDKLSYVFDYILNTNLAKVQSFDSKIKDLKSSSVLYLYNSRKNVSLSNNIQMIYVEQKSELRAVYKANKDLNLNAIDIPAAEKQNHSGIGGSTVLYSTKYHPQLYFMSFKHPFENQRLHIGFNKNLISELFEVSESQISLLLSSKEELELLKLPPALFDSLMKLEVGKIIPFDFGSNQYLLVSTPTETTGQKFITALRQRDLFEFAQSIRNQNTALALAIISISSILGIIFSKRLTNSINDTIDVAKEISQGNYDIHFDKMDTGEVGLLQSAILDMSSDIKKSLLKEKDLARLENEVKIARLVQQNFFPQNYYKGNKLEVSGFYEPATECGGDWWGFFEVEKFHYFLIGDATGHGASSALMTAKAYSLVNTLKLQMLSKRLPVLEPATVMDDLNSVFSDSKQILMMTFFIARLNTETGELLYANASHEFPILIPNSGEPEQLMGKPQARLGHRADTRYKNYSFNLKGNDILLLYTDGLIECTNDEDQSFGFKRTQAIIRKQASCDTKDITSALVAELKKFRKDKTFEDDVGFLILKT